MPAPSDGCAQTRRGRILFSDDTGCCSVEGGGLPPGVVVLLLLNDGRQKHDVAARRFEIDSILLWCITSNLKSDRR